MDRKDTTIVKLHKQLNDLNLEYTLQAARNTLLTIGRNQKEALSATMQHSLEVVLALPDMKHDGGGALYLLDDIDNPPVLTAHRNLSDTTSKSLYSLACQFIADYGEKHQRAPFFTKIADETAQEVTIPERAVTLAPLLALNEDILGVIIIEQPSEFFRINRGLVFLMEASSAIAQTILNKRAQEQQSHLNDSSQLIQMLLQSAMEPVPLQDQLDQVLTMLFYLPWLPIQPRGAIFLVDRTSGQLIPRAYSENLAYLADTSTEEAPHEFALSQQAMKNCQMVKITHCNQKQLGTAEDNCHPHNHYCIPISGDSRILGVINLYMDPDQALNQRSKAFLFSIASILSVIILRHEMDEDVNKALSDERKTNAKLDRANQFIRKTFGRYMSDEVVQTILDTPGGLKLGGEQREVTVLMTDLRGFTAQCEWMNPNDVFSMLNMYLEVMTEIIHKYQGTIIEFLGDGILALFGAPTAREDDPQRAVACALEMQKTMKQVNANNQIHGFPELTMGGAVNTGMVVAGNIGSAKRSKYGVVGTTINLTGRIESLTVGGQVLISQSTRDACGDILRIDDELRVSLKGVPKPTSVYQVGAIEGKYRVHLPKHVKVALHDLQFAPRVQFMVMDGKSAAKEIHNGRIIAINHPLTKIETPLSLKKLTNLKVELFDKEEISLSDQLYGKVLGGGENYLTVYFTSLPPEIERVMRDFT